MRLQKAEPGDFRLFEIALARFLALPGQVRPPRKVSERCWVGADHQAHDLVGPLLIEAVLAVECGPHTHASVTLADQYQATGGVNQYAVCEVSDDMEQSERC